MLRLSDVCLSTARTDPWLLGDVSFIEKIPVVFQVPHLFNDFFQDLLCVFLSRNQTTVSVRFLFTDPANQE